MYPYRDGGDNVTFCRYINTARKPARVSVDTVLRFAGTNDCTQETVDFMLSPGGLGLLPKSSKTSRKSSALTVDDGRRLLGRNLTMRRAEATDMESEDLNYALGE